MMAYQAKPWDVFARKSGNPKIPTAAEAMHEALAPAEAERFVSYLRALVAAGQTSPQCRSRKCRDAVPMVTV